MKIGNLTLSGRVLLAPMAGVTDWAFRQICREQGAALTVTEMASTKALWFGDRKSPELLRLDENPAAAQIFGSDPETMAWGAQKALELSGCAVIDINMGCPAPKIVNNGDGAALMRDPARAAQIIEQKMRPTGQLFMLDINMGCPAPKIVKNGEGSRLMQQPGLAVQLVRAVVGAVGDRLPVSVKMRLGWDDSSKNVLELAQRLVQAGASVLAIHGRTREQFYAGRADWQLIAEAADILPVPVIGNGDIDTLSGARLARSVVGIGINVNQSPEDFSEEIRDMATSLAQVLGHPVRRAELAAQVVLALDRMYAGYPRNKAEYLEKYRAGCLTTGHPVQLITPNSRREAFAREIDDQFNLVVELPDGTRETISTGEVSVRGMYGYV